MIFALKRFMPAEVPETAVVLGQGSIGLFFTWMLKHQGVARVIASEPLAERRVLARRFGADAALDPARESVVDAVRDLNQLRFAKTGDREIGSRIAAYELAFRMQSTMPGIMNLNDESKETHDLYGIDSDRRLCEEVHFNLAYRWFCRLSLEDDVPDHSSVSRTRPTMAAISGSSSTLATVCITVTLLPLPKSIRLLSSISVTPSSRVPCSRASEWLSPK